MYMYICIKIIRFYRKYIWIVLKEGEMKYKWLMNG